MKTKIYKTTCDSEDADIITEAVEVIKNGGFAVLPTETVYGIAVNLNNENALTRLYEIKNRSKNKPLSIHIANIEDIDKYAREVLPYAWRTMFRFWPGPLTVLLRSKTNGAVGLRMPKCGITRNIISKIDAPVGMPSANKSGNVPACDLATVLKDLDGLIDIVLDCGPTELGKESTVVDLTFAQPKLLREGAIDFELIKKEALKKRVLFVCTGNSCRSVMAQYLFQKELSRKENIEVDSAGIGASEGMISTNETLDLLNKDGINASMHRAKLLSPAILKKSDLVFVMSSQQEERVKSLLPETKNKVYLLREFAKIKDADLDIPDPIGQSYDFYRDVYYKIKEAILKLAELI